MAMKKIDAKFIFRVIILLGFLVFIGLQIKNPTSLTDIYKRLKNMNYGFLFISALVFFVSILFSVKQWQMLLKIQKIFIPYTKLFQFYFIGLFFNNFLPSNWGGDAVRLYDTSVYTNQWEKVTSSIVVDRLIGFFALFFIGFLTLVVFYFHKVNWQILLSFLILLIMPIAIFLIFDLKIISNWIQKTIQANRKSVFRKFVMKFLLSIRQYQKEKAMMSVFLISLVTQFFRIAMNIFVAFSLKFYLPLQSFFIIVPIIGFASAIPISIAGIGQRETAGKWSVHTFLSNQSVAFTNSIVIFFTMGYLVIVAVSLLGGVLFLMQKMKKGKTNEI